MQIVTDTGMDMHFPAEMVPDVKIHVMPQLITIAGVSYRSGIDITPDTLYPLLEQTGAYPTTSLPSAGEFAELYRKIAAEDPDILSIHMSSGLSGTFNAARAGAEMVPEARITLYDTKTLCAALGWQVWVAARAIAAGWDVERILALVKQVGDATESMYTLKELKYLIHGGRISHMKGLIASALKIKPLIGVEKVGGTYTQLGMARRFESALDGLVKQMLQYHPAGTALRTQVLHSYNPEGAALLRQKIEKVFQCEWLPVFPMSPPLGAHTGPSMTGVAFAAADVFANVP